MCNSERDLAYLNTIKNKSEFLVSLFILLIFFVGSPLAEISYGINNLCFSSHKAVWYTSWCSSGKIKKEKLHPFLIFRYAFFHQYSLNNNVITDCYFAPPSRQCIILSPKFESLFWEIIISTHYCFIDFMNSIQLIIKLSLMLILSWNYYNFRIPDGHYVVRKQWKNLLNSWQALCLPRHIT